MKKNPWVEDSIKTVTRTKIVLSKLSIYVRTDQYKIFENILKPNKSTKVLDVGVSSDETLEDTNIFERLYPYKNRLTAATIEEPQKFRKLYTQIKTVQIHPHKKLPFKDNAFDIVTAWATLEHVGDYKEQETFLNELLRVGKRIFLTTPYRGCIYELHTGLLFIQWLPLNLFRRICSYLGKGFWATSKNLNPLYVRDIKKMKLRSNLNVDVYKTFGIIPSHLIIYA